MRIKYLNNIYSRYSELDDRSSRISTFIFSCTPIACTIVDIETPKTPGDYIILLSIDLDLPMDEYITSSVKIFDQRVVE